MKLDGLIFPSVQAARAALNVVLFHKAARVKALELPAGATIEVNLGSYSDEGWERDYSVIEEVLPEQHAAGPVTSVPNFVAMLHAPVYSEEPQWDNSLKETL